MTSSGIEPATSSVQHNVSTNYTAAYAYLYLLHLHIRSSVCCLLLVTVFHLAAKSEHKEMLKITDTTHSQCISIIKDMLSKRTRTSATDSVLVSVQQFYAQGITVLNIPVQQFSQHVDTHSSLLLSSQIAQYLCFHPELRNVGCLVTEVSSF
jgi:hypothetical protein